MKFIVIIIALLLLACAPVAQVRYSGLREAGELYVQVNASTPIMLIPGESRLTARISGALPDCPTIAWYYGDGLSSSNSSCLPDRVYETKHTYRSWGTHDVTFAIFSEGRLVGSGVATVQVGAQ